MKAASNEVSANRQPRESLHAILAANKLRSHKHRSVNYKVRRNDSQQFTSMSPRSVQNAIRSSQTASQIQRGLNSARSIHKHANPVKYRKILRNGSHSSSTSSSETSSIQSARVKTNSIRPMSAASQRVNYQQKHSTRIALPSRHEINQLRGKPSMSDHDSNYESQCASVGSAPEMESRPKRTRKLSRKRTRSRKSFNRFMKAYSKEFDFDDVADENSSMSSIKSNHSTNVVLKSQNSVLSNIPSNTQIEITSRIANRSRCNFCSHVIKAVLLLVLVCGFIYFVLALSNSVE